MADMPSFGARTLAVLASEEDKQDAINPANSAEQKLKSFAEKRSRVPMSVPRTKLTAPDIPGYHCHWINDHPPGRIEQAQAASYEFVNKEETVVISGDLAGSPIGVGTDLGSRVSLVVGSTDQGQPIRAYLMKIRNEYFEEDQKAIQGRVDSVQDAMRQGRQEVAGESPVDRRQRYVRDSSFSTGVGRFR